MLFSSPIFLFAFLPIVILVYYGPLRSTRRGQNLFLLLASLVFYGWANWGYMLVMVGSILANYGLGLWARLWRERGLPVAQPVTVAAFLNLGLLFVFKYLTFLTVNLRSAGWAVDLVNIALPVGISFFTFQALSYVVDVARGEAKAQKNPIYVGLYIAFFPQLIAGPIVKYRTVADQITGRRESWGDFSQGCYRFLIGLGKKVILANQLAVIADGAFAAGGPSSVAMAWLGSFAYTLQIYFDFGGYSDMAIGLGRMFGFQFHENFRYPYLADSFRDFWRRWHISLSAWFRDYVYIPLGGSRTREGWKLWRNLLVVWVLTGVWHGANWTFLCWGLVWFVLLGLERLWPAVSRLPLWVRRGVTFLVVNLTWVIFRADSIGEAGRYLGSLIGLGGVPGTSPEAGYYLTQNVLVLAAALVAMGPFATWLRGKIAGYAREREWPGLLRVWDGLCAVATAALCLVAAAYLAKGSYNPFIYFNF